MLLRVAANAAPDRGRVVSVFTYVMPGKSRSDNSANARERLGFLGFRGKLAGDRSAPITEPFQAGTSLPRMSSLNSNTT
jgi:hypothetical protein